MGAGQGQGKGAGLFGGCPLVWDGGAMCGQLCSHAAGPPARWPRLEQYNQTVQTATVPYLNN